MLANPILCKKHKDGVFEKEIANPEDDILVEVSRKGYETKQESINIGNDNSYSRQIQLGPAEHFYSIEVKSQYGEPISDVVVKLNGIKIGDKTGQDGIVMGTIERVISDELQTIELRWGGRMDYIFEFKVKPDSSVENSYKISVVMKTPHIIVGTYNGKKKESFDIYETIYARGEDFEPSSQYTIYVIQGTEIQEGTTLRHFKAAGEPSTVKTDANGTFDMHPVWYEPHEEHQGEYLIVVSKNDTYQRKEDAPGNFQVGPIIKVRIFASNEKGEITDRINVGDSLYAKGMNFNPEETVHLYLVYDMGIDIIDGIEENITSEIDTAFGQKVEHTILTLVD